MDLSKLNSATKYPSILTYHEMGDRGRLSPNVQVPFPKGQKIRITEKLDGTNGRVVMLRAEEAKDLGRRYLIGSREEFLTADRDLVYNHCYSIVPALTPAANGLGNLPGVLRVFFFEVFGGSELPAAKQYTDKKQLAARLFDVATIYLDTFELPIEKISAWREHGGQTFASEAELAAMTGFERVPFIGCCDELPTGIAETYEWLKTVASSTKADLGGGKGKPEGVVVRTDDRKAIAKLRFEDYERTLGVQRGTAAALVKQGK